MKHIYILAILVLVVPQFALAESFSSEIQEEATDLSDKTSETPPTTSIDEEMKALAPYEAPLKKKAKHQRKLASTHKAHKAQPANQTQEMLAPALSANSDSDQFKALSLEKESLSLAVKKQTLENRMLKAQLAHAQYEAQMTRLEKEIADLKAEVSRCDAEAKALESASAQQKKQQVQKTNRKATRLHVAYESIN